jgi:hypothetical protein
MGVHGAAGATFWATIKQDAYMPPSKKDLSALTILQGVGKGTYSTRVSDAFGMHHIAAGDLVRAEMKKGSDVGKEVMQTGIGCRPKHVPEGARPRTEPQTDTPVRCGKCYLGRSA